MIRNRYNQVPHLAQDTNGKVANSQIDTTNKILFRSTFMYYLDKIRSRNKHTYTRVLAHTLDFWMPRSIYLILTNAIVLPELIARLVQQAYLRTSTQYIQ